MRLSSIELENVQVFEKPVTIRFAPLTFLYGPNSAGKSVLEDVFKLLGFLAVNFNDGTGLYNDGYEELLHQCKRRTGQQVEDAPLRMRIAVTLVGSSGYNSSSLTLCWTFVGPSGETWGVNTDKRFELHADDVFLLSLDDEDNRMSMKVDHPLLSQEGFSDIIPLLNSVLAANTEVPFQLEESGVVSLSPRYSFQSGLSSLESQSFDFNGIRELDKLFKPREGEESCEWWQGFSRYFYNYFGNGLSELERALTLEVVSASRKIPEPKDLVYLFNEPYSIVSTADKQYFQNQPDTDISSFALPAVGGDRCYRELAEACFWVLGKQQKGYYIIEEQGKECQGFLDNIQRTMLDHIFVDTGYRIDYDYRMLVSPENLAKHDVSGFGDGVWLDQLSPMYLRLFLRDKNDNALDFSEVGSGLGYALPVIVAVWHPHNAAYLQQPELHLHPALQASLGDVFIDAIKSGSGRLIVETHSEHVLLRVLKRIRQTNSQSLLNQEQSFSADQVAVNYFLPKGDGTTEVRFLRLSPDGDFLDRWPQGFFAERDKELFDE